MNCLIHNNRAGKQVMARLTRPVSLSLCDDCIKTWTGRGIEVTKVDAASDGHPVLQADGGESGVASTTVARASTPSQQDGAAAIGRS